MPIYHTLGTIPRKRHTVFRQASGALYVEELVGHEGFAGSSSLLYHLRSPARVASARTIGIVAPVAAEALPLRHRHFRTAKLPAAGRPTLDRVPLLFNADVALLAARPRREEGDTHFYRNAQADELVFVSRGRGRLETPFGALPFRDGDYLVIHRGILHRYVLDEASTDNALLIIESRGHIRWPRRYRSEMGQLREGAPFSERDIRRPVELATIDDVGEHRLLVKQHDRLHELILTHHPFDVVGWDGYYYPWAFNIEDFEPIVGRLHQPPPVHQTFEGDGFVVCSFCPRPFDFDRDAVPAPYHHSNVGSDEVLYYASAEFMSRKGIAFGSVTHHPDGIAHGPHPGRAEASVGQRETRELAVMLDSFRPLAVAAPALAIEDPDYFLSWLDDADAPAPNAST